jgi:hypothetical protein
MSKKIATTKTFQIIYSVFTKIHFSIYPAFTHKHSFFPFIQQLKYLGLRTELSFGFGFGHVANKTVGIPMVVMVSLHHLQHIIQLGLVEKAVGYGGELAGRWGAKEASAQAWPATEMAWRMKGSAT